ncbi:MAG: M4 family metallopeptidase [Bdellovibrionota bacterium]
MIRTVVLLSALSLLRTAYAADLMIDQNESIERLRQAYDRVQSEPSVRETLRDRGTHSLSIVQREENSGVETTKFQHFYKGLAVEGSMVFHHVGRNGTQVRDQMARFDLDVRPSISLESAVALAKSIGGDRELGSVPELKILPSDEDPNSAQLIYDIRLKGEGILDSGREILLDAHTGNLIANLSDNVDLQAAGIEVHNAQGTGIKVPQAEAKTTHLTPEQLASCQVMITTIGKKTGHEYGTPQIINPSACPMAVVNNQRESADDASGDRAAANSRTVLDYYLNNHNRNSYDGRGSTVVSVVHVGENYANAFWNEGKNFMVYGDGDGINLGDLTKGLDVVGHEMTHGVTAYTAKLGRMKDAGALNEATSDFFGVQIAHPNDWIMGESVALGDQAIRNLEDPSAYTDQILDKSGNAQTVKYPDNVSKRFTTSAACGPNNDNCYVHLNSTIHSHALYLMAQALGNEQARKIYYVALTQFLKSTSTFQSAAQATFDACTQVEGSDDKDCEEVKQAFAKVGLNVSSSDPSQAPGSRRPPSHRGILF